jgi:hypothetical protein
VVITSTTIARFTAAVTVFYQYVLERPNIQCLIGHDRLQPPILFLELAQPAQLRHFQTAVLAPPSIERGVPDPVPPTQLGDLRPTLGFL